MWLQDKLVFLVWLCWHKLTCSAPRGQQWEQIVDQWVLDSGGVQELD